MPDPVLLVDQFEELYIGGARWPSPTARWNTRVNAGRCAIDRCEWRRSVCAFGRLCDRRVTNGAE
jgi:hypothetical protein